MTKKTTDKKPWVEPKDRKWVFTTKKHPEKPVRPPQPGDDDELYELYEYGKHNEED